MVFEKITKKFIEDVCNAMKFYDKYGKLPDEKTRIDITISQEALNKLEGKNRSKIINDLILTPQKINSA